MDRKLVLFIAIILGIVFVLPEWYSKGCFLGGVLLSLPFVVTSVSLSAASRKLETIPALIAILFMDIPIILAGLFLEPIVFWAGIFCGRLVLTRLSQLNSQSNKIAWQIIAQ